MPHQNRYAVFGHPVEHSKSPQIHREFAKQTGQTLTYEAVSVPPDQFNEAIDRFFSNGGHGLNCTVPLKELAYQISDELSEESRLSGAVNTLMLQENGKIFGHNTDGIGLIRDLTVNLGLELQSKRILLLGAGGASRGIIGPLLDQQPTELVIANRTVAKAQTLSNLFNGKGAIKSCGFDDLSGQLFDLILNATSASLSQDLPSLPDNCLCPNGVCYDLAYASLPTPFVKWGLAHGANTSVDGLGMLVEQAAEAFTLWRGVRPNTQNVIDLLRPQP